MNGAAVLIYGAHRHVPGLRLIESYIFCSSLGAVPSVRYRVGGVIKGSEDIYTVEEAKVFCSCQDFVFLGRWASFMPSSDQDGLLKERMDSQTIQFYKSQYNFLTFLGES